MWGANWYFKHCSEGRAHIALVKLFVKKHFSKKYGKQNKWTMPLQSSMLAISLCKDIFYYSFCYAKEFLGAASDSIEEWQVSVIKNQ